MVSELLLFLLLPCLGVLVAVHPANHRHGDEEGGDDSLSEQEESDLHVV